MARQQDIACPQMDSALTATAAIGAQLVGSPLRDAFLRWQCNVRKIAMREAQGRPDDAIMPMLVIGGGTDPAGRVITVLSKAPGHSMTPELQHMARKTNDPAQRREQAIKFFSASYYQRPREFSDVLTATFPPASPGAEAISAAKQCSLIFDAYSQRFDLVCNVCRLAPPNPLFDATIAHNRLFNPNLPNDVEVLGFQPDWAASSANPPIS